jgi:short-subunit dehydrogenase
VSELGLRGVTIDALVNGAALRHPGSFVNADETELLGVLQVNLAALAHLTRLVLPGMLARRWGRIVNFSSADALRLGSRRALSRAGEAFVLSFSLALADELGGSGVRAIAVCLPPALPAPSSGPPALEARSSAPVRADLAEIAAWGYLAVKRGRPLAVRGMRWQARAVGTRLLPTAVVARVHRVS